VKTVGMGGLVESQKDVWAINLYDDPELVTDKPLSYHAPKLTLWYASQPCQLSYFPSLLASAFEDKQTPTTVSVCQLCGRPTFRRSAQASGGGQGLESGP